MSDWPIWAGVGASQPTNASRRSQAGGSSRTINVSTLSLRTPVRPTLCSIDLAWERVSADLRTRQRQQSAHWFARPAHWQRRWARQRQGLPVSLQAYRRKPAATAPERRPASPSTQAIHAKRPFAISAPIFQPANTLAARTHPTVQLIAGPAVLPRIGKPHHS